MVAYEADAIDPGTGLGWSVIVTGIARQVTGHHEAARYEQLLQPWVAGDMSQVLRISPEIVTGYRLDPTPDQVRRIVRSRNSIMRH